LLSLASAQGRFGRFQQSMNSPARISPNNQASQNNQEDEASPRSAMMGTLLHTGCPGIARICPMSSDPTATDTTVSCLSNYTPPMSQVHCAWVLQELRNETDDYPNLITHACPTIENACPQLDLTAEDPFPALQKCTRTFRVPPAQRHCSWFLQQVSMFGSQSKSQGRSGGFPPQNGQSRYSQNKPDRFSMQMAIDLPHGFALQAIDSLINAACPGLEDDCTPPEGGGGKALKTYHSCLLNYTAPEEDHCDWLLTELKNFASPPQSTASEPEPVSPFGVLKKPTLSKNSGSANAPQGAGSNGMNGGGTSSSSTQSSQSSQSSQSDTTTNGV